MYIRHELRVYVSRDHWRTNKKGGEQEWVVSHMRLSYETLFTIRRWVTSHINESCLICMSHASHELNMSHTNESCFICDCLAKFSSPFGSFNHFQKSQCEGPNHFKLNDLEVLLTSDSIIRGFSLQNLTIWRSYSPKTLAVHGVSDMG